MVSCLHLFLTKAAFGQKTSPSAAKIHRLYKLLAGCPKHVLTLAFRFNSLSR